MPEMLSIVQQLLVAGNETTTKMLTEMMRLLGENPEQWRMVKEDPSRDRPCGRGDAAPVHADAGHVADRHP